MKLSCDPHQRFTFKRVPAPDPLVGNRHPGEWYFLSSGEAPYIVCPECGHAGRLGNHQIRADGSIEPSIVCPMASCGDGVVRCSAHYYGRLESYRP